MRVTPRAGRSAVSGVSEDEQGRAVLGIRLAAPPVDGAANEALVTFLAEAMDVPKGAVRIASGETQRVKQVDVALPIADVRERLQKLVG